MNPRLTVIHFFLLVPNGPVHIDRFKCHLILLLASEYEELQRQISDASSQRIQDDLERELDRLVKRMEAKGEQIKKLGRYQTAVSCCF